MDIEQYSKYKQFYTEKIPGLLLEYLDKHRYENFLDLGCGDGSLLHALNKKGYFNGQKTVYAVDLSENRINLVKKINKNFRCFVADACNVSQIENNSIDFLVSSQVIEHVNSDESMIKEIYRLLEKNGIVYISTVFKKWYGWYFYKCDRKWTLDPTHLREYAEDSELLDIFNKNGFEVLENKKTLVKRSLIEFILKRTRAGRQIFANYPFLQPVRNLSIPILGYYNWEIVCKKN